MSTYEVIQCEYCPRTARLDSGTEMMNKTVTGWGSLGTTLAPDEDTGYHDFEYHDICPGCIAERGLNL